MSTANRFLFYANSIGALEFGKRKLKSGRISPYFFNSGLFCTGESIGNLAEAYSATIKAHFEPDVVFGPAYKGIPIVATVACVIGGDVEYAFNRKEAKDHGEGGVIVGAPIKDKKVVIVDDVITTKTTADETIGIVKKAGGIPIGYVIAFDRQERAMEGNLSAVQEFQEAHQIPVRAAATLADLIELLRLGDQDQQTILYEILQYQKQYGV